MEAQVLKVEQPFSESMAAFLDLTKRLQKADTKTMTASQLESLVVKDGREVLRTMLEERIRMSGVGNVGSAIEGSDGAVRTHLRERPITLKTLLGEITVDRTIYSVPGGKGLAPKEFALNLPDSSYSHGLQKLLTQESAKGSFDEAIAVVENFSGVKIPKRQAEELVQEAAQDFDEFYNSREEQALILPKDSDRLVILTTDGKGVIMRRDDLRKATQKKADEAVHKLKTRLARGEKKNSKRMAQVAAVYTIGPFERTAADVLEKNDLLKPPKPESKRVWASLTAEPKSVIEEMFQEALRRDPLRSRPWCVLVDGQPHQLTLIKSELKKRRIKATIIVDLIHVIEYLWKASRDFHGDGTKEGEEWVSRYLAMILDGEAKLVAAAIRRSATRKKLTDRDHVDTAADYFHKLAPYLRYDRYLKQGMPIATGVIEGACRYLVKDRMDVTGARWSLKGAEAVLKMRSVHASANWEEYWGHHEAADLQRNHTSHYARPEKILRPKLKLVK
jgi:hypothetical protein